MKITPSEGFISLEDKRFPLCGLSQPYQGPIVVTRGCIDIQSWKNKLNSLPEGFWDEEHQVGNVKLTRPAHDAWGIQKIIFTFCDDFLMKVYDLPYSRQQDWKDLLLSVYRTINVNENRIVRSLLARMPSGVTIPVHHDTGYWVKRTHRCHLAIETGEEVEFWVGAQENNLRQVSIPLYCILCSDCSFTCLKSISLMKEGLLN
jgi:NAD-dependent dihydropyrimidine dehydrogenase PreA subunit